MSKRVPGLLVADMIESAEKIISYTDGFSFEEFINDDKTVDAVIRNFEIIGEAANRLPDEFKTANPQIEWSTLRGFSNRIVHDYFGIDYSIVWNIIKNYLPGLLTSQKSV
ncbi:MAG: HepT-like ribonuclease domain-containing protein [Arcticibacter sp.]